MSEFVVFLEVFSYTGSTGGGLSTRVQNNVSFSEEEDCDTDNEHNIIKNTYKFLRNKDSWVLALYNYIYKRIGSENMKNMKNPFYVIQIYANINI